MATKKECDRCKKQWDATAELQNVSTGSRHIETSHVSFLIPMAPAVRTMGNWSDRRRIEEKYELCQDCARKVHAVVIEQMPEIG